MKRIVPLLLALAVGCGGETPVETLLDGGLLQSDAGPSQLDAGAQDSGTQVSDAGHLDGGSTADGGDFDGGSVMDAGSLDAGAADAGPEDGGTAPADGGTTSTDGGTCGEVGRNCANLPCPLGMTCQSAGNARFCVPTRPICGGFAGALCPAAAPSCMYPNGSSAGFCLNAAEKACVCPQARFFLTGCL